MRLIKEIRLTKKLAIIRLKLSRNNKKLFKLLKIKGIISNN